MDPEELVCDRNIEHYAAVDGTGRIEIANDERGHGRREAMRLLLSTGRVGRAGGDWLLHGDFWTPDAFREEILAWYGAEHLPILLECPAWDGCRLVGHPVEGGWRICVLHQLADRSALESEQYVMSRTTAWYLRLLAYGRFGDMAVQSLYRRIR